MIHPEPSETPLAPKDIRPQLVVVIDTEEEFDWSARFARENRSVKCIPEQLRAQDVFERHGIVPTYVIDHPVASTDVSAEIFRNLQRESRCIVGTHLHPWVNPPYDEKVNEHNSYPGNLPAGLEEKKLVNLTDLITENIGKRPVIYKAGRYGYGPATTAILEKLGYEIDASVVPHTDFSKELGPNFRGLPDQPYWFGSKAELLEVPLTSGFSGVLGRWGHHIHPVIARPAGIKLHLPGILSRLGLCERINLTPEGISLTEHKRLTRALLARGNRIFSYTYHSSSLLPGGSPYVKSAEDRDAFLEKMDQYFSFFINEIGGEASSPIKVRDLYRKAA